MNERIALLLKFKNISAAVFADEIDVQRSGISHILSGRNKPSLEFIQKVLKVYPEINPEWLISGKGSMLKPQELFSEQEELQAKASNENQQLSTENKAINIDSQTEYNKTQDYSKEIIQDKNQVKKSDDSKENINLVNITVPNDLPKVFTSKKEVEKIVIFFKDNTFKTYYPE